MKTPPLALLQRDLQQQMGRPFAPVAGPSFPPAVKALATALMVALIVFGMLAVVGQTAAQSRTITAAELAFLLAVGAVIASGYWGIMTSRTSCDFESIEQTWLWRKKVRLDDITQVKLICLDSLSWLIVPRLVVRSGYGLTTFHAGDPDVLARFRLLAYGR